MISSSEDFCEHVASRIDDLYESYDDVIQQNPRVELYGKTYSFRDVQKAMTKQMFISVGEISPGVNADCINGANAMAIKRGFENIPRASETCVVQWTRVEHATNVIFSDAEMKDGKFFPPRFFINVGDVAPNSSVRINTGFVLKIPRFAETRQFKDGQIVRGPLSQQPPFVIVPHITCPANDFVPCLFARDSEDTGLFTVHFTTVSGRVGTILVVLKAYRVKMPVNNVCGVGSKQSCKIFKPKDTELSRYVQNLGVKINFDSMSFLAGNARCKTSQSSAVPEASFEYQQPCSSKLTTRVTSRKREWNGPNLLTLSGLYSTQNSIPPKIVCAPEVIGNTRRPTFVDARLNLFSEIGQFTADMKIIDGAFSDQQDYAQICKKMHQSIVSIQSLSAGAKACKATVKKNRSMSSLKNSLRLFDYHRGCVREDGERLAHSTEKSDCAMFKCRPARANAYSVILYSAMKYLISIYFRTDFTPRQLEELRISITPSENADLTTTSDSTARTSTESMTQPMDETLVSSTI
uniref:Uncharacterized protein n=1 Tax=Venturia canescens TaxID=32260 RepID=A0A0U1ZIS0_9HYME|nr:hypothetical protein [Venturia canescens]